METDPEDHGKLMQGETTANGSSKEGEKSKPLEIDIYFKRHGLRGDSGSVTKYRTDRRKCCIYFCALFWLLAALGVGIFLVIYFTRSKPAEVETSLGRIKGLVTSAPQGGDVEEYLGIPFAKPPLGELRYADPQPYGNFPGGEYDAVDYQSSCLQYPDTTFGEFQGSSMWNPPNPVSEDCLFLNIWVPRPHKKKRTVMVWIYGGGFFAGSNALWVYDGKALATHTDVIVVSFNYRVNTFGYLTTGDGRIKGNFGMKDQVMALQWVKDHIEAFGGDPDSVTIFGESSGASSAGLHMMHPGSDHLFKRAIFESGSADCHWAYMTQQQARTRSQDFFKAVNCSDDDEVLSCLRNHDADFLLANEWVTSEFMVFPWAVSVDGDFLTDTPYNLLKAGKFQKKDSLLGVNRDEGTYWILYTLEGFSKDNTSTQSYTMFKKAIPILHWDLSDQVHQQLISQYSPVDTSDKEANRDQLDKLCGDRSFTCPTKELTRIYADQGIKTYFYYLTYRASTEVWPDWMGVIHGAEIQWVFGMPLNKSRGYTDAEVAFSKDIMSYWANFAKYGDPNGEGLSDWPQYTPTNPEYVEMKAPSQLTVNTTLRENYCQFWNEINRKINEEGGAK